MGWGSAASHHGHDAVIQVRLAHRFGQSMPQCRPAGQLSWPRWLNRAQHDERERREIRIGLDGPASSKPSISGICIVQNRQVVWRALRHALPVSGRGRSGHRPRSRPACPRRLAAPRGGPGWSPWSSTHSTRRSLQCSSAARGACRVGAERCANRTVNQNVLPWPGALSTPIVPPITSTSRREIAKPEARAAVLPRGRGVGLGERLEQPRLRLGRDADAGVGDLEADQRVVVGSSDTSCPARRPRPAR